MTAELSAELVSLIESTHVAFEGLSHPLRLVNVVLVPPPPMRSLSMSLTVEVTHEGVVSRGECVIGLDNIKDHQYVVEALAMTMRDVLTGDLKPGDRRLL